MKTPKQHTVALLQGVVGKPLKQAIHDLGCPTLPNGLLNEQQSAFLRTHIDHLPASLTELNTLLATNALAGKVVQAGTSLEGDNLFTVHLPLGKSTAVLTFAFYKDEWKLHEIESVRTRRRELKQWLIGGAVGAVVTAAIALLIVGINSSHSPAQAAPVTSSSAVQAAAASNTATSASKDPSAADKSDSAGTGEKVTFTLKDGMTTGDLTDFLKQEGLIHDQAAFNQELTKQGIDTKLKPKDYTFTKGMTEEQVIAVLNG